jgi:hypothetical protein
MVLKKRSLFNLQLLTGVSFFCIMFIPSIPQSQTVEFHCNAGMSLMKHCLTSSQNNDSCLVNELRNNSSNEMMHCKVSGIHYGVSNRLSLMFDVFSKDEMSNGRRAVGCGLQQLEGTKVL